MAYYKVCPLCGSHLDPGEKCTCQKDREREAAEREQRELKMQRYFTVDDNGQMKLAI